MANTDGDMPPIKGEGVGEVGYPPGLLEAVRDSIVDVYNYATLTTGAPMFDRMAIAAIEAFVKFTSESRNGTQPLEADAST